MRLTLPVGLRLVIALLNMWYKLLSGGGEKEGRNQAERLICIAGIEQSSSFPNLRQQNR